MAAVIKPASALLYGRLGNIFATKSLLKAANLIADAIIYVITDLLKPHL